MTVPPAAAFGAGITLAALFLALPRALVFRPFVPLVADRPLPWWSIVLACTALAALSLVAPLAAAVVLLLLLAAVATLMNLTAPHDVAKDLDMGTWD